MLHVDEEIQLTNCSFLEFLNVSGLENNFNCNVEKYVFETKFQNRNKMVHLVLQIMYGLIFVGGICGNCLVIYVVTKYSKMHTVTNFYILNLAVADILYLMGLPFLLTTLEVGSWIFGNIMCKLYMITTSLNQFTSSLFLTIMSADRYIAVCHPISSQKYRTSFISKIVSLTAWTLASLMIVPVFMYSTTLQIEEHVHCNIYWSSSSPIDGQTLFTFYSLILSFALPFALIFIFYGLVINKLEKIKKKSNCAQRKKSQRKITRLVLSLIIVYALCYLPYWSLQVSLSFMPPMQTHSSFIVVLFLLSSCLCYSNSAVNPVLYAFLSENFMKSFQKACFCRPKCSKSFHPRLRNSSGKLTKQSFNRTLSFKNVDIEIAETKAKAEASWEKNFRMENSHLRSGINNFNSNSVKLRFNNVNKNSPGLARSAFDHPYPLVPRDDAYPVFYRSSQL